MEGFQFAMSLCRVRNIFVDLLNDFTASNLQDLNQMGKMAFLTEKTIYLAKSN